MMKLRNIDDREIKKGMLDDTEYRTDYRMKGLQRLNIPHWVDLGLKFIKPLYSISDMKVTKWGSLFYMGTLYTENDGTEDGLPWDRKYWMNEILKESRNSRKRHCTPFIVFKQLKDKSYELIDINKIAVEVGPNGRSYLYINDLNEGEFYNETSNLKVLLLPSETDYLCSNMESTEDREEDREEFNEKYITAAANITISENNELSFDSDQWYEKIKLITMDMNIYKGSISSTDRAIAIGEDNGIKYGQKIYLDSLILVNPDGHVDLSYLEDGVIKEMENNILYFDTDRFTGYNYYIFFFNESNKSINMIYDIPEQIITHDTTSFVQDSSDFILLDRNTFMDIMSENGKYDLSLKIKDLKEKYSDLFELEISPDTYKNIEKMIYKYDEEGNIIYEQDSEGRSYPILDPEKLDLSSYKITDGVFPIDKYPQSWYKTQVMFINYWFYRVLNYKKNLLMAFVNDDYKMFDRDIKYTSVVYPACEIPGEDMGNGDYTTTRRRWTIYDEDLDYDGWSDILVFINGCLDLSAGSSYSNKTYISKDYIIETYGEDAMVEVVYINYNADAVLDVKIENTANQHFFKADRYYDPRSLRFFNIIEDDKMSEVDDTPIYHSQENNPTHTQPIPFKMHLTPEHNQYSIQFNENWAEIYKDIKGESPKVCIELAKDGIINAWAIIDGQVCAYDITAVNKILYEDYLSDQTLDKYLENTDIKITDNEFANNTTDAKDCTSITYTELTETKRGIAFTCGNSINDRIEILANKDQFTIENKVFGNIIKLAKNVGGDKFAFINSDDKMFDIAYSDSRNEFFVQDIVNLDIKELYPIESHNVDDIITDSNTEIYYANNQIYVLSVPMGNFVQGLELYDSEGNLLYDKNGNILRDGSITNYPPIKSLLRIYDISSTEKDFVIVPEPKEVNLNKVFIGAKIIATETDLYIIGGNTGHAELDQSCYKYNFDTGKLKNLNYPEWLGYANMSYILNDDKTKLIVLGGIGNWPEDTANKIGILDLSTNEWSDPIECDVNFVNATVINHNDKIIVFGGYKNENDGTIKFENISTDIYSIDLKTGKSTIIGHTIVPFISAKATHTVDGMYLISGNKYPEYSKYLYKYNPNAGSFSRFIEMPEDYDYISLCEFNYCRNITSILLTGEKANGFNTAKVLNIRHQNIDCFFADKYSRYCVMINGMIYRYEEDIMLWLPVRNLQALVKDNPITRIELSGDLYVALAGGNTLYTSPDLIAWYDYKFTDFYDTAIAEVLNVITDVDFITTQLDNVSVDEFDRNKGISIMITKDGKLLLNPYCMNTSMYYGNTMLIASTNRFATQAFTIAPDTDKVILNSDFKYCLDESHYAIFEDGKILPKDCYKVVMPSIYSPVSGIEVYLNYHREEDYSTVLSVVYLPFPMINTESKIDVRESSGVIEVGPANIKPFGVNNKWNWVFTGGEKIPFSYMRNVSNTLIYLDNWYGLDVSAQASIYRTYGDDLAQNPLVNDNLDEFINDLIKNIVKDTHWGDDANIDLAEFTEKATFEEKIVLLKVYADHYVENADEEGTTPPYTLDSYQGQFYDVLNGNIEWRD